MDESDLAPVLPLLSKRDTAGRDTEGASLPVTPLARYDPIGDVAGRLGVSRRTAKKYDSRALGATRAEAEGGRKSGRADTFRRTCGRFADDLEGRT